MFITEFVNCTPHPVVVLNDAEETILTLPKCENPPRLTQATKQVDKVDGIRITETHFGDAENLPLPLPGRALIVSRLVLAAYPDRSDLLVPNETVRNEKGHIIGCKSFARN